MHLFSFFFIIYLRQSFARFSRLLPFLLSGHFNSQLCHFCSLGPFKKQHRMTLMRCIFFQYKCIFLRSATDQLTLKGYVDNLAWHYDYFGHCLAIYVFLCLLVCHDCFLNVFFRHVKWQFKHEACLAIE